ncbi:phosphodiester glycosidase family protein [Acholeplasma granularum]|uniref:phosphodiester glycosidase family protein n=1 Tax=Acholeplasma granularum TaxID=264635 RepID=UPI0004B42BD2|nr:phosphodiester glycosidase family protein [Acholeplasma granularum]
MKKIWILLLIPFVFGFTFFSTGLDYVVLDEVISQVDGVTHQRIQANLYNDNQTKSIQEISILKKDETIETTVWSYFGPDGTLINKDILTIAQDFETKHPEYEVLAGINGDYFTTNQTINSNIIFGSKVVNPQNHSKYLSIEMDLNGTFINSHKQLTFSNTFYAYIYDKNTNALFDVVELLPINTRTVNDGQTSIFYNYSSINNTATNHYSLDILEKSIIGQHQMFYATNPTLLNTKIETSIQKLSIITKNDNVINLLDNGAAIKIQKRPTQIEETHTVVGVDSKIIDNGTIKLFSEIGGQSESNNTARHPRTGIGFDQNNNPILFTVDGRNPGISDGVNLREFAKIMAENGILNGFNLDGGGSTQVFIKKDGVHQMVNKPSDTSPYRRVSNAILFIKPKDNSKVIENITSEHIELTLPSTNYEVYLNGTKINHTTPKVEINLNPYKNQVISVINPLNHTPIYQKLIYLSEIKGPTMPVFSISHEIKGTKIELLIEFLDPDFLISKMNATNTTTNELRVALVQYMGLRKATFDTINTGKNDFIIDYELKNGYKGQLTYSYTHNDDIEEPVVPDIPSNPDNNDSTNLSPAFYILTISTTTILLAGIITLMVIIRRKK